MSAPPVLYCISCEERIAKQRTVFYPRSYQCEICKEPAFHCSAEEQPLLCSSCAVNTKRCAWCMRENPDV